MVVLTKVEVEQIGLESGTQDQGEKDEERAFTEEFRTLKSTFANNYELISPSQDPIGRNVNNLRKISIFILNTVDLAPTRSMVAPAKSATKQRERHARNANMRFSIVHIRFW